MKNLISLRRGFSIMEMLVTIGIIVVISVAVILFLNPAQIVRAARDSTRISNIASLGKAAELFTSLTDHGSIGSSQVVYVSIPDPAATSTAGTDCSSLALPSLPIGWTYHCAASSSYRNLDGTGWLPLNLSALPSGVSFSSLLIDPVNATSSGLYYAYSTDGVTHYELTAAMESQKYGNGGSNDTVSADGGQFANLYESGNDLTLAPNDHSDADSQSSGSTSSKYAIGAFEPPIQAGGAGVYKLGRTLPIKFSLTNAATGAAVTDATAYLYVFKVQNGVVGTTPVDLSTDTNDGSGKFRVSGGKYIYNLDTGLLGIGTWQIKALVNDGSSSTEIISFDR